MSDQIPAEDTSQRALTDLSSHELASLTSSLFQQESSVSPLVSPVLPISDLKEEYQGGAKEFLSKIDGLEKEGWKGIRRMRGDGECFYRAFAYSYIERIVAAPVGSRQRLAQSSIDSISKLFPFLDQFYSKDIYEDFLQPLLNLLQSFLSTASSAEPTTSESLLAAFNDPEVTHSVTYFFRLLTSAYLKSNKDDFEPFLWGLEDMDPRYAEQVATANGGEEGGVNLDVFCSFFVEAVNKEADHIQITALTRALKIHTRVAYLDRSLVPSFGGGENASESGQVNFIEFEEDAGDALACALLYRPGHFDVIYKEARMLAGQLLRP